MAERKVRGTVRLEAGPLAKERFGADLDHVRARREADAMMVLEHHGGDVARSIASALGLEDGAVSFAVSDADGGFEVGITAANAIDPDAVATAVCGWLEDRASSNGTWRPVVAISDPSARKAPVARPSGAASGAPAMIAVDAADRPVPRARSGIWRYLVFAAIGAALAVGFSILAVGD